MRIYSLGEMFHSINGMSLNSSDHQRLGQAGVQVEGVIFSVLDPCKKQVPQWLRLQVQPLPLHQLPVRVRWRG